MKSVDGGEKDHGVDGGYSTGGESRQMPQLVISVSRSEPCPHDSMTTEVRQSFACSIQDTVPFLDD